jgi:hypothetical protein
MKLKKLSEILFLSFWLGLLLLAFWSNVFILWDVRLYASHAPWFSLNYHEFALFQYGAMILLMLGLLIFFLIPWLGIKWYQYRRRGEN